MNAKIYTRYSPRPAKDGDAERAAANEDAESIRLQVDVCHRYAVMKELIVTETIKDPETCAVDGVHGPKANVVRYHAGLFWKS